MNLLARNLSRIFRENPLNEKWVIAPSRRVGYQWLDTVARSGQPVVNARVKTLASLALDLAAAEMSRTGAAYLSGRDALLLVGQLWAGLEGNPDGYLSALPPSEGLIEAMGRSLQDIRLAGLRAEDIDSRAFEVPQKGRESSRLLHAYTRALDDRNRIDYAGALRLAAARLRERPDSLPSDLRVLVPADIRPATLERSLLEALPSGTRMELKVDEPATLPDGTVRIVRAVGEACEVRAVLRHCLSEGIALDDVEILYSTPDPYLPLLYESARSILAAGRVHADALPVTFADGIPTRYFRPGRALMGWMGWVRGGYPQPGLLRLVQEGLVEFPGRREAAVSFGDLARQLGELNIGAGRERCRTFLERNVERRAERARQIRSGDAEGDLAEAEREQAAAELLHKRVAALLELSDWNWKATRQDRQILESARTFLTAFARTAGEDDEYARRKLLDEIEKQLDWLDADGHVPGVDVPAWLERLAPRLPVGGLGPRPGCIYAAPMLSAGHSGRRHTFILGLDDRRFPGAGLQDPLLLDHERSRISDALPTAHRRMRETIHEFARLLGRLRGTVTLSYPCRDVADDRELFASPVVLSAWRILSGNHEADQAAMDGALPPESFAPDAPERCVDSTEWWLHELCGKPRVDNPQALLDEAFPHLARGRAAEAERQRDILSAYDGYVPHAGRDHDPARPDGPVMSARRMELIGRCPRAYFLRYILEVEPLEEAQVDPHVWIDALQFGTLLHGVFHDFFERLIRENRLPAEQAHGGTIQAILDSYLDGYIDADPPPNVRILAQRRRDLESALRIFLQEEQAHGQESSPAYLEASVGMETAAAGTALDTAEPVRLELPGGKAILARGRLDRIDRVPGEADPAFSIWDYKTGSPYNYKPGDPFRQGRQMQPVLYLAMAEARVREVVSPDARVVSFGYFFPTERGRGDRVAYSAADLSEGLHVLENLCDVIAGGCFVATDNSQDDCKFCEFRGACGDVDATAAHTQRKLKNLSENRLDAFRHLRGGDDV